MRGRPQRIRTAQAGALRIERTDRSLGGFRILVAAIGLAALGGLAVIDYKIWKAENRLGSAVSELHDQLAEISKTQGKIKAGLADLNSSYTSLRSDAAVLASRIEIRHSPEDIDITVLDNYEALADQGQGFSDASARDKTPCDITAKTAVVVTLGQSNAANAASTPYTPRGDVLNFSLYDGNCYRARDPLIGTAGEGGNFATPLADMLIERGLYDRVIIAPIAIGGSSVEQWAEEGPFNRRILVLIRRLFDVGLGPTQILWHQGEGNPGIGDSHGRQYRKNLLEVITTFRRYGISAPFFVALATKCGDYPRPNSENIREGQRSAVNPLQNVFLGPDTDSLGDEYRADRCHFNAAGLQRHGAMWAEILQARALQSSLGR
jgi:carbohydrate esterase-like sialic acid-specific acetylesterase